MQPITQTSLDPKLNYIRHLRAEQEFCGVIGCFGLVSPHPHLRTSLTYSQSYRLHGRGSWPDRDMQDPSVLTTRATRKTTRIWVRDAKYNAAGAMHRVAWALQNSKAIGQKCEKPWENLWFCSGEDRNRTTYKFPGKLALRPHARREIRRAPTVKILI